MPSLDTPPELLRATVHAPRGLSYVVYAVLAVFYAVVGQKMVASIGEPYRTAVAQLDRIEATHQLVEGLEKRSLLQLQDGLTKAADIADFNATLFHDGRALLRALRKRMENLTAAVEAAEVGPLRAALERAIELHADGRPIIDRFHMKSAAKKLQELQKRELDVAETAGAAAVAAHGEVAAELSGLYGRVKEALELSRGADEIETVEEPAEKKLPSKHMPSFSACLYAFLLALATALFFLGCHWSVPFRALMYFHPTSSIREGTLLQVTPPRHRGKAAIVPVRVSSRGLLHFEYQRQVYEVRVDDPPRGTVGAVRPLLCPTAEPLRTYSAAEGLSSRDVDLASELHGKNSFAIPLPTFGDLYKEQLSSPIAIFQLFCCVLWMLDEYWKYTLFTLFMILCFEGTTAFSRQKNMQTLRGMSNKAFALLVYRDGAWAESRRAPRPPLPPPPPPPPSIPTPPRPHPTPRPSIKPLRAPSGAMRPESYNRATDTIESIAPSKLATPRATASLRATWPK